MTKMAATPIYGKTLQNSSPEPVGQFPRNLVCGIWDSNPSNDDHGTLTYFTARVVKEKIDFYMGKVKDDIL